MSHKQLQPQRGVVILLALLIVAITATLASLMMLTLNRETHRTQMILNDLEATEDAKGATAWAIEQIRQLSPQAMARSMLPIQSPIMHEGRAIIVCVIYNLKNDGALRDPSQTHSITASTLMTQTKAGYIKRLLETMMIVPTAEHPYFLLETVVTLQKTKYRFYTLLQNVKTNQNAHVNIIWQGRGST
ncbi:MAG: hypothetical protein A3F43_05230 [Gammaproteobacteria bacterium RIFCSPHIGHO2_12_FULL_42_10]|nr:MAG: hypothetical protein A3F43_05230 [Gammaproteobacteria bacterium RIFCSPHIGHO2_12_FULL_42_10]